MYQMASRCLCIRCISECLARKYISFRLNEENKKWISGSDEDAIELNATFEKLKLKCWMIEKIYFELYKDDKIIDKINVSKKKIVNEFRCVCDALFSNGISWNKIACIYMIAGYLAVKCDDEKSLELLSENVGTYIATHLCCFILQQGGWSEFI